MVNVINYQSSYGSWYKMKNIRDLSHYVKKITCCKRLQLIGLLFISLSASNSAFALRCADASNDSKELTDSIINIAVPQSAAEGTVIWRSENRTMTVRCWKEGYGNAEQIYAYMNPKKLAIGNGVSIGLVLNGQTMSTRVDRYEVPGVTAPRCNSADEPVCKRDYSMYFTASYYVYIAIAKPVPQGGNYTGADTLPVFQLDGVGGVNAFVGNNFNYILTGLSKIRFIPCEASVSVSPNNIDFGNLIANEGISVGSVAKSSDFKATVTKTCDTPFKLTALYSSPASKVDSSTLDLNNGVGLRVKNLQTSNYVQFGDVNEFADMTSTMSTEIPFLGELTWLSQKPTVGEFNTSITIDVYYN
jgi:hypothetical protein